MIMRHRNLTSILPGKAFLGLWLGPYGHADLISLENDPPLQPSFETVCRNCRNTLFVQCDPNINDSLCEKNVAINQYEVSFYAVLNLQLLYLLTQDLSIGRPKEHESVVHAADTGDDDELDSRVLAADGLSPLQRMQCIANSLPATTITQSVPGAASSRQLLPPVTAEQMAACEDTNTDDVVAKVRRTRITL